MKADLVRLVRMSFRCNECDQDFRYPMVLLHNCVPSVGELTRRFLCHYESLVCYLLKNSTWDPALFGISSNVQRTDTVIRACGLEPDSATGEDMHHAGCILAGSFVQVTSGHHMGLLVQETKSVTIRHPSKQRGQLRWSGAKVATMAVVAM